MKTFILSCMLAFSVSTAFGQGYQFTEVVTVPATPVKNQAATGTCWCFATTSFMESELLRMGKGTYDLSEMSSSARNTRISCRTTICVAEMVTSDRAACRIHL